MSEPQCRMTNHEHSLNRTDFNRLSCAKCYEFLKYIFIDFQEEFFVTDDGYLFAYHTNNTLLDLNKNTDVKILKDIMNSNEFNKWSDCCQEAKKCCSNTISSNLSKIKSNNSCDNIWDGWSCHMKTMIGEASRVRCPNYIVADHCFSKLGQFYQFLEFYFDKTKKCSDYMILNLMIKFNE